jgi:hypothetical protein
MNNEFYDSLPVWMDFLTVLYEFIAAKQHLSALKNAMFAVVTTVYLRKRLSEHARARRLKKNEFAFR